MQEKEEEDAKSRHQLQHQVIQIKEETYNTTHSQKGEEDVARDKVDAPKPKRRLLTSTKLTMIVMERARWMSSPGFEILAFANEFLNCCNRY